MIGNKIAGKITSVSKKPFKKSSSNNNSNNNSNGVELTTHKKRYISSEKR